MVFHKAYWPVPHGDWDTNKTMNKEYLIDFCFLFLFMSISILTKEAKLRTTSQRTTYLQYVHGCYQLLSLFPGEKITIHLWILILIKRKMPNTAQTLHSTLFPQVKSTKYRGYLLQFGYNGGMHDIDV